MLAQMSSTPSSSLPTAGTQPNRAARARPTPKSTVPAAVPAAAPGSANAVAPVADGALDTRYLETLLGYNARRTAVIAVFLRRMAPFGLRPVDFSVLSLIAHNPGVTSRQICAALDILPPNLVGLVRQLESRGLLLRKPHPSDRRAQGLHLSAAGKRQQRAAELEAKRLEGEVADVLTADELATLNQLLRRVYQRPPAAAINATPCG